MVLALSIVRLKLPCEDVFQSTFPCIEKNPYVDLLASIMNTC